MMNNGRRLFRETHLFIRCERLILSSTRVCFEGGSIVGPHTHSSAVFTGTQLLVKNPIATRVPRKPTELSAAHRKKEKIHVDSSNATPS
jgi:hypothetical protein